MVTSIRAAGMERRLWTFAAAAGRDGQLDPLRLLLRAPRPEGAPGGWLDRFEGPLREAPGGPAWRHMLKRAVKRVRLDVRATIETSGWDVAEYPGRRRCRAGKDG